jgi:hypothetical protein
MKKGNPETKRKDEKMNERIKERKRERKVQIWEQRRGRMKESLVVGLRFRCADS